jgi:predicted membrane protein
MAIVMALIGTGIILGIFVNFFLGLAIATFGIIILILPMLAKIAKRMKKNKKKKAPKVESPDEGVVEEDKPVKKNRFTEITKVFK